MRSLFRNHIVYSVIGGMIVMMLFGCASVKEMNISQKYENSKSWFKEKWQKVGTKSSSSNDETASIKPYSKNPDYLVYRTQWPYETFAGIADWFTGDAENSKTLAAANPKIKPIRIAAGTPVLIPAKLVKRKTLPTQAHAAKHRVYYYEHRVQWQGESLSLIAKWYTGHYRNWKALARANPGLSPSRIALGNLIYIPPEMMKTKKPLPLKIVAKTQSGYFAHTVTKTDEKLSDIAKWYTGDTGNRKAIADANPDIDPELLLVGNEIYIPSPLLKTRQPLYHKSIQTQTAEATRKHSETEASTTKQKKIQLFGPKQFPTN